MHRLSQRHIMIIKGALIFVIFALLASTAFMTCYQTIQATKIFATSEQEAEETFRTLATASLSAAKKKEPVFIDLPDAVRIRAITEDYTKQNSLWALVNKTHAIALDYLPRGLVLPDVPERTDKSVEERSVRSDVAIPLKTMFDAASQDGHLLMIGSAYRSAALQKLYFDTYVAHSGIEAANQYSAYPGQSEHQTGLAVDISSLSRSCYLDACFTSTPDGQWLAANSYRFGFTLRYPEDKTEITGYNFEPWHYRYVGTDLATALHESNLTLEEAWPFLETALSTLKKNGATLRADF